MRILCSIDMDDAWAAGSGTETEETFLPEAYRNIFSVFKELDASATLFVIGKDIEKTGSFLEQAVEKGFELGNHSFHHLYNNNLTPEQKKQEIISCDILLKKYQQVTGYRAPGWGLDKEVLDILSECNYKYDASLAVGYLFPLLRFTHWMYSGTKTFIYGSNTDNFYGDKRILKYPNSIFEIPMISPLGIPFYHSIHYIFPDNLSAWIIRKQIKYLERKRFEEASFIFHARDFVGKNLKKSSLVLAQLKQNAEVTAIRSLKIVS